MSQIVIQVENLAKRYRLGTVNSQTLREDLAQLFARLRGKKQTLQTATNTLDSIDNPYVWALKDVSFKVPQGQVLGIIGKNGAGKSTLLKLLSKITAPTSGIIKVKGKLASLLEVGTGFHPELTGRENIFLNGAILGMTKAEIRTKLDEIVDFAGISKYIDTPVKRYSSGMSVRLGFAIAAHLEPEILIVDEVLAVGDYEFQKRAIGKMQDVAAGGRTVLFVSHNMGAVGSFCQEVMVIKQGQVDFRGDTHEGIARYMEDNALSKDFSPNQEAEMFIQQVELLNQAQTLTNVFNYAETFSVRISIGINQFQENAFLSFRVSDAQRGRIVFTQEYPFRKIGTASSSQAEVLVTTPSHFLRGGKYRIFLAIYIPNVGVFDVWEDIAQFTVVDTGSGYEQHSHIDNGCVFADCQWEVLDKPRKQPTNNNS